MLYYTEIGLSHLEVPDENSLCIYISGCLNRCKDCHYPELQLSNYGNVLKDNYLQIIDLYLKQATCVCFFGEGKSAPDERIELVSYSEYAHSKGLKTCLYSGRNTNIEDWMREFDYIKLGSYMREFGPLDSLTTNQRMYQKIDGTYVDITMRFWNHEFGE